MSAGFLRLSILAALVVGSAGCAKILGIDDTEVAPPDPGRDLRCVGMVVDPRPNPGEEVEIVAAIVDIATGVPLEGVRVVRCETRLDLACVSSEPVFSDETGIVRVPVTSGFNGYLRIQDPTGDTSDSGLVTYFWYFSQPIVETREDPFPIFAMTRAFRRDVLYANVDAGKLAGRGEIAINSTDCQDANASGIRFEITTPLRVDDDTEPFYFADGQIIIAKTEGQEITDELGIGGFVNVLPGPAAIRAIDVASGVQVAEDTLLVQADVLTTVRLLPQ